MSVFPWGISWSLYGHHSARWEDITEVRRWEFNVPPSSPIASAPVPILIGGSTTYYCKVVLADGQSVTFEKTYRRGVPVGRRRPKPKPGTTKRVNIKQLGRLIEMGVART